CSFFFFQAEDGIRDDLVTGVQTCALPISEVLLAAILGVERAALISHSERMLSENEQNIFLQWCARRRAHEPIAYLLGRAPFYGRSEERRVGKECRALWTQSHRKYKDT